MKICKKIALLAMILILSTTFNVYAADATAEITLTPSVTSAKVGEIVTIAVAAECATGIEGVEATLEWDRTKLEFTNSEQLATTGFTSMSGFDGVDESTGDFILSVLYTGLGAAPTEANFATLTFKVLEAVTADETLSVKLSKIEVGDSNDEWMTLDDKEVMLTVVEDTPTDDGEKNPGDEEQQPSDGEENPGDEEQQPSDGEENPGDEEQQPGDEEQNPNDGEQQPEDEEQKPENQEELKSDTTADKPINNAGLEAYGLMGIVASVLVSIVLYTKYKKYSDVK